jgi:hypothetical protein
VNREVMYTVRQVVCSYPEWQQWWWVLPIRWRCMQAASFGKLQASCHVNAYLMYILGSMHSVIIMTLYDWQQYGSIVSIGVCQWTVGGIISTLTGHSSHDSSLQCLMNLQWLMCSEQCRGPHLM